MTPMFHRIFKKILMELLNYIICHFDKYLNILNKVNRCCAQKFWFHP